MRVVTKVVACMSWFAFLRGGMFIMTRHVVWNSRWVFNLSLELVAAQVMTTEVVTAKEPVSLEEANALLKSSKKGKLPVIDNEGKVSYVSTVCTVNLHPFGTHIYEMKCELSERGGVCALWEEHGAVVVASPCCACNVQL